MLFPRSAPVAACHVQDRRRTLGAVTAPLALANSRNHPHASPSGTAIAATVEPPLTVRTGALPAHRAMFAARPHVTVSAARGADQARRARATGSTPTKEASPVPTALLVDDDEDVRSLLALTVARVGMSA